MCCMLKITPPFITSGTPWSRSSAKVRMWRRSELSFFYWAMTFMTTSLRRVCMSHPNPGVVSWWKRLWADHRHETSIESQENSRFFDFWNCLRTDGLRRRHWEDKVGTAVGFILRTFREGGESFCDWTSRLLDAIRTVCGSGSFSLMSPQTEQHNQILFV